MLKHLTKLIWNRKGENALVLVELVTAFLVIFFVAATISYSLWLYKQPLGYDWEDTWELRIAIGNSEWQESDSETLRRVLNTLKGQPAIEWAHVVRLGPFRGWNWTSTVAYEGREFIPMWNTMTDGAPQDLGMTLLEGRWFGPEDAGRIDDPILINERLARRMFGDASPLGQDIRQRGEDEERDDPALTVIGVFSDFRQRGDLHQMTDYVLGRHELEDPEQSVYSLLVRLEPGTALTYEEALVDVLSQTAPDWRFVVTPLSRIRADHLREQSMPLYIGGTIAAFLVIMVAFGLFGVLWQNVTRRTDELGLRRAVGATRERIYRQIVLEMTLLALFAAIIGTIVGIQFPMLGTFRPLDWRSSGLGIGAATLIVSGLCVVCALYPARLAAKRPPAEALHYE
ncbi:MAG: FtsX-like permease family protein [Pseudomonadota bacterium]